MKYFIILTFLLSSCVVRESRRCCEPCPVPKEVHLPKQAIIKIPMTEVQLKQHYLNYLKEYNKNLQEQMDYRQELIDQSKTNKEFLKQINRIKIEPKQNYHEQKTITHSVHIQSNFNDSSNTIKRSISTDSNFN